MPKVFSGRKSKPISIVFHTLSEHRRSDYEGIFCSTHIDSLVRCNIHDVRNQESAL